MRMSSFQLVHYISYPFIFGMLTFLQQILSCARYSLLFIVILFPLHLCKYMLAMFTSHTYGEGINGGPGYLRVKR